MNPLLRALPFTTRLRPRLGLPNDFRSGAVRSWELGPATESVAPKAVFDEDDLRKITGGSPDRGIDDEVKPIFGGPVRHAPTLAYEFRDALLSRGHLFTRQVYMQVSGHAPGLFAQAPRREFDDGVLCSSRYGVKYFGHWMRDDLTRLLAAADIGVPISVLDTPTRNQQAYLDLLGLAPDVQPDAFFKRFVVIEDNGQNLHKHGRHLRLRALAAKVAEPSRAPGVMLLRGGSGEKRVLTNEAEVADFVRARGFLVLDPAVATARELLEACQEVDVVLGVEGSQLSNGLMWMSRTGTFVVIQPPQRFVSVLKDHCDNLGMQYAFIVCDPREDGGFHLDTSALGRLLDRVSHGNARRA
jgi:hypothetical protein